MTRIGLQTPIVISRGYAYGLIGSIQVIIIFMGPEEYYGYQQPDYQEADPNKMKRIIIGIAGMVMFLFVLLIAYMMLFTTPSIKPEVAGVAAMQNELARVAELGTKSSDARRATQILAANVKAISLTNVVQITNWANDNLEQKFSDATLTAQTNENIDTELTNAAQINEYDEVFESAMLTLLTTINEEIVTVFDKFSSYPDLQEIMNEVGANNKVLIDSLTTQ